nr:M56 family metallopeptidase [uncultured Acetatifactor sp.]
MKYLILMTVSGSGLLVGYLCWERLLENSLTQSMKYRALMVVMLVYAVPWAWLREGYRSIFGPFWRMGAIAAAKGMVDIADIKTEGFVCQTEEYRLWMLMLAIWFVFAILIMIVRVARYLVKINSLRALAIECGDKNLEKTMTHLRESIRYKHKPDIVWTRVDNETFTIGIIKPTIFLQKKYADEELYWILKHEMTHIVKKDLWIKLFLEFISCLHWFNPFIYLLERKMRFLCETSCDERVIRGCTDEEYRTYIELLDANKCGNRLKIPLSSALDSGNEEIEKRITLMKQQKDIQRREKVIAICAFGLLVFLDSLTALAYPQVYHVKSSAIELAEDAVGGGNLWVDDYVEEGYSTSSDVITYDEQFVDKEGKIYSVEFDDEYEDCTEHDKVLGIIQVHIKEDGGGCIVETYEGTRCTKCGVDWKGTLLNKISNMPCTH